MILLIDNYDSFTFNLYSMVQALTGDEVRVVRNNALSLAEIKTWAPSHLILSPGPGHPGKAEDFGVCAEIIKAVNSGQLETVLFGVCLGHQGIVHHLGGRVVAAPTVVHGKTAKIEILQPCPLLDILPNPFEAMRYHSLVAEVTTLPDCLEITAIEPLNKLIMAIRHKTRPMVGVQFHPESIGTPEGSQLLENFLKLRVSDWPSALPKTVTVGV